MSDGRTVELVYDGSCPVCNLYSRHVAIDPRSGQLERIDARKPGELLDVITSAGLDVDEGMVVRIDGRLFFGAETVHELAKLAAGNGLLDRCVAWVFRSRRRAELLYPALKAGRNLLLKLLGRTRINNLGKEGSERF